MTFSTASETPSAPSPKRRGPARSTVAAVGAAALALAATLGLAACGSSNSSSAPSASASPQAGPGHHTGGEGAGMHGVAGKITTEGAGSWMITKKDGSNETVTISSTTEFGSKKQTETAAQFAVGDEIMVVGDESNGTITATRISHAHERNGGASGAPASPSGTAPTSQAAPAPTK